MTPDQDRQAGTIQQVDDMLSYEYERRLEEILKAFGSTNRVYPGDSFVGCVAMILEAIPPFIDKTVDEKVAKALADKREAVDRSISSRDKLVLSLLDLCMKDMPEEARSGFVHAVRSAMVAADDLAIQHPGLLHQSRDRCQS